MTDEYSVDRDVTFENSLDRNSILTADDLTEKTVNIPEWGGQVTVRAMSGATRDFMEARFLAGQMATKSEERTRALKSVRAMVVLRSIIDPETKKRLFTDKDIDQFSSKSAKVINELFNVVYDLSGMSKNEMEAIEKNSESDQAANSFSD